MLPNDAQPMMDFGRIDEIQCNAKGAHDAESFSGRQILSQRYHLFQSGPIVQVSGTDVDRRAKNENNHRVSEAAVQAGNALAKDIFLKNKTIS